MERSPWLMVDCELSLEVVEGLLREQAPHCHSPAFLGEGWDSRAYRAIGADDEPWIFRFPKRAPVAERLAREITLLPGLAPRLPLSIPRFEVIGEPGERYPHRFVGYRSLPGTPAVDCLEAAVDIAAIGHALATFLGRLHTVDLAWASEFGAEPDAEGVVTTGEALGWLDRYAPQLVPARRAWAESVLAAEVPAAAERTLVHNDFFPEHLLIEDGRLAGVIDWGDIALGNPANDLAGLYYWHGEPLLEAGLATYGRVRGLDGGALERLRSAARRIAVLRAAEDLDYGTRADQPAYAAMGLRFLERLGG